MIASRRVILGALGLSLLLNLFLAGFVLVPKLTHDDKRVARLAGIAGVGRAPPELMDRIEQQFDTDREGIKAAFDGLRQARGEVREAMRAEPLDRATLDAALARLRDESVVLQQQVQSSVVTAVADAPAELREQIESRGGRH
jgi:uncharacterized membrane protein